MPPLERRLSRAAVFASAPSEIPARGWIDILLRVYRNISDHRVLALAAGMTFYSLLAIFPALAALVLSFGLLLVSGTIIIPSRGDRLI